MSNIAIKAENISKAYQLGEIGTGTISRDLERWFARIRGKEDPFLRIGETNDRTSKGISNIVWSLKDISFEIEQGDAVGIIGRNGAGKSTLLKILSKVTSPTTGRISGKGRTASLLEVGTGFHPELTGRENVFLNGAILGMRKKEIIRKFDEIVAFAGVERYIDTPVKRYSSGMYVRLAFAVAAHLESEILIVDEVLAVGDAEFQKKCLGKMGEVSKGEGRTILFVSHNMAAVKALCNKSILLNNGKIEYSGHTNATLNQYLSAGTKISDASSILSDLKNRRGNGEVKFTNIIINNDKALDPQKEIGIHFEMMVHSNIEELYFFMSIKGESSEPITNTGFIKLSNESLTAGRNISFNLVIPPKTFRTGILPLYFWLGKKGELAAENYPYDILDSVFDFNLISEQAPEELGYDSNQPGGYFNFNYKLQEITII